LPTCRFHRYAQLPPHHSFPTRRSSDLEQLAWTFNVSQQGAFRHEDRNVFHMLDFVLSKCICLKANSIGDVPRPKVTNPDVAINPSNCRIYPSRMVKILW